MNIFCLKTQIANLSFKKCEKFKFNKKLNMRKEESCCANIAKVKLHWIYHTFFTIHATLNMQVILHALVFSSRAKQIWQLYNETERLAACHRISQSWSGTEITWFDGSQSESPWKPPDNSHPIFEGFNTA